MRPITLLIAICLTSPAIGGVISRDLFEPGDGLLTYDDVNQREWLDFHISSQLFDPGHPTTPNLPSSLADFRLATLADVEELMRGLSIKPYQAWFASNELPSPTPLADLMGLSGLFSGSVLGDLQLMGGYVASHRSASADTDDILAVLAFNFGIERTPGALNRPRQGERLGTSGYYLLSAEQYPFADGPVDVTILDAGDLFTFNVFYDRIQGEPAFWLFRDVVAIPEPSTSCLVLTACLAASRLRAFA